MTGRLRFDGSDRQLIDFLRTFLRKECTGEVLDAISAANRLQERWGIRVDWHELSYALEAEVRCGWATVVRPGEFVQYIINSKPEV